MEVHFNAEVVEFNGEKKHLTIVIIKNNKSGEISELHVTGVFVFIGLSPNSQPSKDVVKVDSRGFILMGIDFQTGTEGIFAAGSTKQLVRADGEGAAAALAIRELLRCHDTRSTAAFASYWAITLYQSWNPVYLVTVRHLRLSDPLYLTAITLPYVVGGIALLGFGTFADRVFRHTGSHRRSYVYPVTALLIVSALCLYLAVSVPSALGSVIFFTLAFIGATVPILSTIITVVTPAAHRGAILGTFVEVSTLPGLIAPLVTGLIIQSAGSNIASGFYHAYLLASLLLLIGGIAFLAFAGPDDEQLVDKVTRNAAHLQS